MPSTHPESRPMYQALSLAWRETPLVQNSHGGGGLETPPPFVSAASGSAVELGRGRPALFKPMEYSGCRAEE